MFTTHQNRAEMILIKSVKWIKESLILQTNQTVWEDNKASRQGFVYLPQQLKHFSRGRRSAAGSFSAHIPAHINLTGSPRSWELRLNGPVMNSNGGGLSPFDRGALSKKNKTKPKKHATITNWQHASNAACLSEKRLSAQCHVAWLTKAEWMITSVLSSSSSSTFSLLSLCWCVNCKTWRIIKRLLFAGYKAMFLHRRSVFLYRLYYQEKNYIVYLKQQRLSPP